MATKLLNAVIATGAGTGVRVTAPPSGGSQFAYRTFQAIGSVTAATGASVIYVEVSNTGVATDPWIVLGTITLTLGTTATTDGFASQGAWEYVRGNINSISGTNATVSLWMGT
jgi:hypothetical protein